MALRDLVHNLQATASIVPAARTDGSVLGASVDLRGFGAAMAVLSAGVYTDGVHQLKVQHSDDDVLFSDVDASELQGELNEVDNASFSGKTQKMGYVGNKRYIRLVLTTTGSTSGALICAHVIAGKPGQAPVE